MDLVLLGLFVETIGGWFWLECRFWLNYEWLGFTSELRCILLLVGVIDSI